METSTFKPKGGRGFGRSSKFKINNFNVKAETLSKESTRLFIDFSAYVKFDCDTPKQFQEEYKLFNRRLKKKSYQLSNLIFKGLRNNLFMYTTTFSSTSPELLYSKYNYFCGNVVLCFNHPIGIVEEDVVQFGSEMIHYLKSLYLLEPKGKNKRVTMTTEK